MSAKRVTTRENHAGNFMHSPFPFTSFLLFSVLSILLLIGVLLRAKVTVLQRFLFPSCLIGGAVGLILNSSGLLIIDAFALETFAFHLFNVSFISVGLTPSETQQRTATKQAALKGPLWMALVQGITLPLQAIIGGLVVILFGLFGVELFATFGFLAPLGFTEGPGQVLSIGKVWEQFGFAFASTIGLTFAAIGYLFAFFIGVPLVNWGIHKGLAAHGKQSIYRQTLDGIVPWDQKKEIAGKLTMLSGNIDTFAFQTALVGLVYLLTYGFLSALSSMLPNDAAKIIWGFFFIFGMIIALTCRWAMGRIGIVHTIDPGIQRRITGWAVDYLIVATVMAIQLVIVWQYILPIAVTSVLSGFSTLGVILYLGRRLDRFNLERTAVIYGTCTGTVSSGLLLLRIVDPEFKTPAAIEIGLMNVISMPIIGLCLVLVNAPVWWSWSVGLTCLVFAAMLFVCLGLIRVLGFWQNRKF